MNGSIMIMIHYITNGFDLPLQMMVACQISTPPPLPTHMAGVKKTIIMLYAHAGNNIPVNHARNPFVLSTCNVPWIKM